MSKIITDEMFQQKAKSRNSKVTVIGKYTKMRDPILVRCNKCGREYSVSADNVLSGKGCRLCSSKEIVNKRKNRLKYEDIKAAFESRGYKLLTKESSSYYRVKYLCPVHGEMEMLWNNFSRGAGCRKCATEEVARRQYADFNMIENEFKSRGYTLLSTKEEYRGAFKKLRYLCPIHGEQKTDWNNFRAGKNCPECAVHQNDSKVARGLKDYCKKMYPDTVTEYKIVKNPKTGRFLPYDIYIPSEKIFCEVMGQQHYKKVSYFQRGENDFEKQFERDNIKEDYAVKHGRYIEIDLRRIKNVEDAIKSFESLHNSWISKWAAELEFSTSESVGTN